ncbi:HD domain-containing protein [Desulfovibrio sp. UCD-KL4C]|uniref:HD domain-containing protein n=1 Tax=Desulfovibrio sp. UCD-KL4C TaxID=2578120 RepID=UPI0025BD099F|nr:HD domain-containing protein [Desulfovibrio sp. UCD-KL4C]
MESCLIPPLPVKSDPSWYVPTASECMQHWDDFKMLDNIKAHSTQVAKVAVSIALIAEQAQIPVHVPTIQASALMHDIAKTYSIKHGGNHSQLGAAWTLRLTGNPVIAMGVLHHVFWPFEPDAEKYFLPLVISYSDKRVMHDTLTSLEKRFNDLAVRYGKTEKIKQRIQKTFEQALVLEQRLENLLGVDLNACSFDSGRLV